MVENYEQFIILNNETNKFYKDEKTISEYKVEHEFCDKLSDALVFDTRKEANEYIREWIKINGLIVKKLKIKYEISK